MAESIRNLRRHLDRDGSVPVERPTPKPTTLTKIVLVVFIFTATAILASRKRGQEVVENDDPLFQLL